MKRTDTVLTEHSYPVIIEERETKEPRKKWRAKRNRLTIIVHQTERENRNDNNDQN